MANVNWDFSNRRVAVTGAAVGMGAEAVRAFAAAGATVFALDVDAEKGFGVCVGAEGDATFIHTDVTDRASVGEAFERIGSLDVLINNAGGFWEQRTTEDTSEEEWDRVVDLNLKGVFLCSQAAIPALRDSVAGRLIHVSSLAGQTTMYRSSPPYAAAKAGIHAVSRNLAYELAADGITSNVIAPSAVLTDRILAVRGPDERAATEATIPLGRYGTPEDIVNWMLFLASDEAGYMTGQTVTVNGGRFMS